MSRSSSSRARFHTLAQLTLLLTLWLSADHARAWELFRSESSAVERGNEHLAKGQHQEALAAYDEAARELPDDPAVQLDRGLALSALGKLKDAREAFRRAGSASSPREVRGPALYDLGLTFLSEADQLGQSEDFAGAKKELQEAVDAFRGSLRAQPNNQDAGWNLELAKRRLVDVQKKEEEKKKRDEEEKKKQDEQKQDQQNQDQQKQDQQNQDQQNKDPQQADGGAPQPSGDGGAAEPSEPESADAGAPEPKQPPPDPQAADGGAAKPEPPPPEPSEAQPAEPAKDEPNALPEHMRQALDALESGEENLEKVRAKQRARSRPRRIDKDW